MAILTGVVTLNPNEIYAALSNMIISQEVFANPIADGYGSLVDRARVDGSLYGDKKLYTSTDILKSRPWTGDNEAANLLQIERAPEPKTQEIELNVFRQVGLSVDYYLSKRGWMGEGVFSDFTARLLAWLGDTKQVYDETTYNSFIGTNDSSGEKQNITISLNSDIVEPGAGAAEFESINRINAQKIAQTIADLFIQLRKPNRDYNDLGFMRSYKRSDLLIVWNSKYVNEITKLDLPSIFHSEEVVKDLFKEENILPPEYFGGVLTTAGTTPENNTLIRALVEGDYGGEHKFAGELLPNNTTYEANTVYREDTAIICKIMHKRSVPYMSAFQVRTSFFNARALVENNYLTWGHNKLEHLAEFPFITLLEG